MMAKYTCEDYSDCRNEIQITFQQINEKSEQNRKIFDDRSALLNEWRLEQLDRIQQIYDKHLKLVQSENEMLSNLESKLFEQLKENALKPLEKLKCKRTTNQQMINHIQETIRQVRKENEDLTWSPSISLPPDHTIHRENGRLSEQLVTKFGKISSIEESKKNLVDHIEKLGEQFRLPVIICSYLTVWYRKHNPDEKVFLLNEYLTVIKQYLSKRKSEFDVLIGIQIFFHNQSIKENQNEMMTYLLQFFLHHRCINQHQILEWYNSKDIHGYKGFPQAKQLAKSFIRIKQEPHD